MRAKKTQRYGGDSLFRSREAAGTRACKIRADSFSMRNADARQEREISAAFTLVELLIAVAIFAVVSTIVAAQYVTAFRETRAANSQNQIYEDARYVLERIAQEINEGTVDYDEYYNQNVVLPTVAARGSLPGAPTGLRNFGQNFGRYYSAFFYPGEDGKLGFNCNDMSARNRRTCAPLRRTIDRNVGANPFPGKASAATGDQENAFCGTVRYNFPSALTNVGVSSDGRALCSDASTPNVAEGRLQKELYLISADGSRKTILAREKIGIADDAYALSILRLRGADTNGDGILDKFICAPEFQCRGTQSVADISPTPPPATDSCGVALPAQLPRENREDLTEAASSVCDPADGAFAKDFVPISPLRVKVTELKFIIFPAEDPRYAFAEDSVHEQPRVTVVMTIAPNPDYSGALNSFRPLTLVETVPSHLQTAVVAPILKVD